VCFGVKLDKLLLDSHKRVKKDKEKNFKKKTKIFSLSSVSRRSQISRHFHQLFFSFEKKKKLKRRRRRQDEEHRRITKNHLISSSRTTLKYTQQK